MLSTVAKPKGFFPKKGWRKVNGEWVAPAPDSPPPSTLPKRTAADRRNWANRMAGWAVKENK